MKNIILIAIFTFVSLAAISQVEKEQSLHIKTFKLDYTFLDFKNNSIDYANITDSKNTLFIYNKDLNLNDVYLFSNNTLKHTGSILTSSSSSFTNNRFKTYKKDSFNPYGANSFGEAVVFGLINTIFK